MNQYTQEQIAEFPNYHYQFIRWQIEENTLRLTLNRPEKKNALHPKMVDELNMALHYAHHQSSIWNIVLDAEGDVFCSGADLKAMRGDVGEISSTVPDTGEMVLIAKMFKLVLKPIILVVHADVMAGGMLLVCGATHVVAQKDVRFHLPEVRRGLFPFQVLGSLVECIQPKLALQWCVNGEAWTAQKALENHLIHEIVDSKADLAQSVQAWKGLMKLNSPTAIKLGLEAYNKIMEGQDHQAYLMAMLGRTLQSNDAKEGLLAFKEKREPNWIGD